ncbi:MAG: site-specific integrase [Candidatus Lambdaproteobacteria bacterium]|nr:site-specific integrase [Candidatus Lambdaproteobacteria bacterium]
MPSEIVNEYARYLQAEKGIAAATRQGYRRAVTAFLALCAARPEALLLPPGWTLERIDKRSVEVYLTYLRRERGWRPASIARQVTALRSFFAYLQRQGLVTRNPLRTLQPDVPPADAEPPQGDEAAVLRLFDVAPVTLAQCRLLAVLELGYGLALRPSQIYAVRELRVGARGGLVHIALEEQTLALQASPGGLRRLRDYLRQRRRIAQGRADAPFWIDERGRAVKPVRLARAATEAMTGVGLNGGLRHLRQLAALHFRERGGDVRSLQRLLRAKRLGRLDRYEPPAARDVVALFRLAHPRARKP